MGQGHAGRGKPSRLTFVGDGENSMLLTTGFSSSGQRQFALWDSVSGWVLLNDRLSFFLFNQSIFRSLFQVNQGLPKVSDSPKENPLRLPRLVFFTDRMLFLTSSQQYQTDILAECLGYHCIMRLTEKFG